MEVTQKRPQYSSLYVSALLLTGVLATPVCATQDVDDPHVKLQILRALFSTPAIANDVSLYALRGCRWNSEVVWTGTATVPGRINGGVGILFQNEAGDSEWLNYSFSVDGGMRNAIVRRDFNSKRRLTCRY